MTVVHRVQSVSMTVRALGNGGQLSISVDVTAAEKFEAEAEWMAVHENFKAFIPRGWSMHQRHGSFKALGRLTARDPLAAAKELNELFRKAGELSWAGYWFEAGQEIVSIDHMPSGYGRAAHELSFARFEPGPLAKPDAFDPTNPTSAFMVAVQEAGYSSAVEFVDGEVLVTLTDEADDVLQAMSQLVETYVGSTKSNT